MAKKTTLTYEYYQTLVKRSARAEVQRQQFARKLQAAAARRDEANRLIETLPFPKRVRRDQ